MRAEELFEQVTADLVAAIEAGASGWRMPWQALTVAPRSVDGRAYRGWNALVLGMTAAEHGWCGVFATYRGWQRHGAQVRRGEKGTTVVLWKPIDAPTTGSPGADDAGGEDGDGSGRGGRRLLARTFTVFALEQVDGAAPAEAAGSPADGITAADAYFTAVGAAVHLGGDRACYVPALDVIRLPERARFERAEDFYSTAAHEHVHWTGHRSRLARDLSGRFGDRAYGAEELIAELGAAFWCARFGLHQATRDDHAAYLGDWLALLRADARALVAACGHAQRAVDHLDELAARTLPTDDAGSAGVSGCDACTLSSAGVTLPIAGCEGRAGRV
jgi:antirestriction protein ArdC